MNYRKSQIFSRFCLVVLLSFAALLGGCSKDDKDDKKDTQLNGLGINHSDADRAQILIKIVDDSNLPIKDVAVLVGNSANSKDLFLSDAEGQIDLSKKWQAAENLSFSKTGYVRATYLQQMPSNRVFVLRKQQTIQNLELSGTTTGFNLKNYDGKVDFGITMPALKKLELFDFQLNQVISDEVDVINLAGYKVEVPSNITFPTQRERYSIIDLKLDKPNYRIYFETPGLKKVFTTRGQFPVKKVIDQLRQKKEFYEVINDFTLMGGTLKEVDIKGAKQNADFNVSEMNYDQKFNFAAPELMADETMLGAALGLMNETYIATDIKNFESKQQMQLASLSSAKPLVISVLKKKAEFHGPNQNRGSYALTNPATSQLPVLLPLQENPRIQSAYYVSTAPIKNDKSLTPLGTYAVLAKNIVLTRNDGVIVTKEQMVWEVYGDLWTDHFEIPVWPDEDMVKTGHRWTVSRFASSTLQKVDLGPTMMNSVSHVTKSSTGF